MGEVVSLRLDTLADTGLTSFNVQSGLYVLCCCRERYSLVGGMEWHGVEGQVLVIQRLHLVHVGEG